MDNDEPEPGRPDLLKDMHERMATDGGVVLPSSYDHAETMAYTAAAGHMVTCGWDPAAGSMRATVTGPDGSHTATVGGPGGQARCPDLATLSLHLAAVGVDLPEEIAGRLDAERVGQFVCPVCGSASSSPDDKRHGYCGRCHAFTAGVPGIPGVTHADRDAVPAEQIAAIRAKVRELEAEYAALPPFEIGADVQVIYQDPDATPRWFPAWVEGRATRQTGTRYVVLATGPGNAGVAIGSRHVTARYGPDMHLVPPGDPNQEAKR